MSVYDKASLVLIPSGTKTGKLYSQKPVNGDGDFTFSRSTAATRVNASGNIEKQTGNYILYSQQIDNAYWNKYNISVTANQATAPDGTTTADLIDDGINTSSHLIEENETIGYGGAVTASIHAKYVNTQYLVLAVYDTAYRVVVFDIQNGTIGNKSLSTLIPTIEDLGNGWYRCAVTNPTNTRNDPFFAFGLRDDNGAGFNTGAGSNRQAYVWGAQLEDGLVARDYIETTTTAVEGGITDNVPRLDYTDASCPSLLLEPQRTNVCPNSEDVSNWYLTFATATPNDTISPEGVQNAAKIVTSNNGCDVKLTSISVSPSTTYTASFYCKLTSGSGLQTRFYDNTNGANIEYYTYDSQIAVGEWKRVTRTFTTPAGCNNIQIWFLAASSSASVTAHYWGYQLEAGSYATSYIPTYGSAVTRNAESCLGAGDANTFNSTEGVLYWEGSFDSTSTIAGAIALINYAQGDRVQLYNSGSNFVALVAVGGVGTSFTASTNGSVDITTNHKYALKWALNDFAFWVDGVEIATDTSGATFSSNSLNELRFSDFGANYLYANTKQVLTFNTALSDTELADLTTI